MPKLTNHSKNETISEKVVFAFKSWERIKGLLGKTNMESNISLWISPCSSIHTFFMQFPIDVIFVDRNLIVISFFKNVQPWRILFGGFKACSTFEMKASQLNKYQIQKGDQLHVGD